MLWKRELWDSCFQNPSESSDHLNIFVGPTTPMLHTKSQGHRPSGSGEEDF